ncbi:MAG: hypothetical protein WCG01_04135 [bacterium]
MPERVKKIINLLSRSYLVLLPAAVFLYLGVFSLQAQTVANTPEPQRVNIAPSVYEVVSGTSSDNWLNPGLALLSENLESASFSDFNQENSASLKIGEFATVTPVLPIDQPSSATPAPIDSSVSPSSALPPVDIVATPTPEIVVPATNSPADCTQSTTCTAPVDANPLTTDPLQGLQNPVVPVSPAVETLPPPTEPVTPTVDVPTSRRSWTNLAKLIDFFRPKKAEAQDVGATTTLPSQEYALIYKDFSLPSGIMAANNIANVQLRLSMAAKAFNPDDKVKIYYNVGTGWFDTGVLFVGQGLANATNKGYFLFGLPIFTSWQDLTKLQIKVVYEHVGDGPAAALLDGVWLEVDYSPADQAVVPPVTEQLNAETELSRLRTAELNAPFTMEQVSLKNSFKTTEGPDFNFLYRRKESLLGSITSSLLGLFTDQYAGVAVQGELTNEYGRKVSFVPDVNYLQDGEFHVKLPDNLRDFRPGKYAMILTIADGETVYKSVKDFSWGVLSINTSKSVYLPTEEAYLQMAVLDDTGNTICDADLYLEVTAPDGGVAYLNTDNGLISRNEKCGPNNVINEPDYFAHYGLAGVGLYQTKLIARTSNGVKEIVDQFEVRDALPFEIERIGPTRIWPVANYPMRLHIKANEDYSGPITEIVPASFKVVPKSATLNEITQIKGIDYNFIVSDDIDQAKDTKILTWQGINLKAGDVLDLEYEFDAPDISPEFFLLGPLSVGTFSELRMWQVASDAVSISDANGGTSAGAWTTPANAWNSTNNNYAVRAVAANANETTIYLKATGTTATSSSNPIVKVEIGIEGLVSNVAVSAALRPLFNGVATGTAQTIAGATLTTADLNTTFYVDVTNDAAGPRLGNWTWADVQNLDVLVNGVSAIGSVQNLSIDQIRVRVTYDTVVPVGTFNSAVQTTNGSGDVDMSIEVSDADGGYSKARLEYAVNPNCTAAGWSYSNDTTINPLDASTTADFGDPKIDNNQLFQIGTTTGWIVTASGSNSVFFDWNSKLDAPTADGEYCLRLTVNDGLNNSTSTFATTTLDNVNPTAPGQLSAVVSSMGNGLVVSFGASSTDTNFKEYKIFYHQGTSSVNESDIVYDQTDNPVMANNNYGGASGFTINDLLPLTTYTFNIWAYDLYGNKASSTAINITTSKAEPQRANTVYYLAGQYVGDGSVGQNSNTNQSLPAFNFSLAETAASIKNAYIIFESHFESYANNVGNYTGYDLGFDACQSPCTPSAFGGTGIATKTDATVLAYDQTAAGSNYVRLLFDVTNEAQLAAYQGGGATLSGQVGYNIKRTSAVNSISESKAMLVITYQYAEKQTVNQTNTVFYPLESTVAGHSGTRLSAQIDDCVLDSTCPKFTYRMDIPEIKLSLADWYQMYNHHDNGTTGDLLTSVNLDGTNIDSATYVYELAQGGGQGGAPIMYFPNVSGFVENATSTLEYKATSPGGAMTHYLIGGEAVDTYVASSSATIKTKTVSFPLGVTTNGNSTAQASSTVNVYFPENGTATGTVQIKKAWFRVVSNNGASAARTLTLASKTGNNAITAGYAYAYNSNANVVRPVFNIVHVMPSAQYDELANANLTTPKPVTLYTTNNNVAVGGVAAELMITYTYTSEKAGHLSSLNLYGGQAYQNGNSRLATTTINFIAPESNNTKTLLGSALLASYLFSDSDAVFGATQITLDANASNTLPTCTNAFNSKPDTSAPSFNNFSEFYRRGTSTISTDNNSTVYTCTSNNGGGYATAGGKMNTQFLYTYLYTAPQPVYTQNSFRFYENGSTIDPVVAKATEKTSITNINLWDIVRLRVSAGPTIEDLAVSQQDFDLQYAFASSTCSAIASSSWYDVGTSTSNTSWRSYNNPLLAAHSTAGSVLLASSTNFESYEEDNPTLLNPVVLTDGKFGEWDFNLFNFSATSSQDYCFRMVKSNGTAFATYLYYPKITTAASNTAPTNPINLLQYLGANSTSTITVATSTWINQNTVRLVSSVTDVNYSEGLSLFYQLATSSGSLLSLTSVPASPCAASTTYASCASKVWRATSSISDYRLRAFTGTATISTIPDDYNGYKWQVLACDDSNACSIWMDPGVVPTFRVDTIAPTAPGLMTATNVSANALTLKFGTSTTEANFAYYKIFYKKGTSSVRETDTQFYDNATLLFKDYAGATSTYVNSLSAGTIYAFNIWAYDMAGNKASSTVVVATTTSSFTAPTSYWGTVGQKTDGTGGIDMIFTADDPDNDDTLRAKIEYELGSGCLFTTTATATLNTADASTYAYTHGTFNLAGDPKVDNTATSGYRIGTSTGWIITSPGASDVYSTWNSKLDAPTANNTYCLRLTVSDGGLMATSVTKIVMVDNVAPTAPGALTLASKNYNSLTLNYGAQSIDSAFSRYRIFYSTTSPVTELGTELADSNLALQNYNGKATTSITGLLASTTYYVNIWAYDVYGNRTSAVPQVVVTTNSLPSSASSTGQFRGDNSIIYNGDWTSTTTIQLVGQGNDPDASERLTLYHEFIPIGSSYKTATTVPAGACMYGTSYTACASKIWYSTTSAIGNYSISPFKATTTITNVSSSSIGYKWQTIACDDDGDCSAWFDFNSTLPNILVDNLAPTAPGALTFNAKTSANVTLNLGARTVEANFASYKIYYASGTPPIATTTSTNFEYVDLDLSFINYNGQTMMTIPGLAPSTTYYFNIWAYDEAGQSASSTAVAVTTNAVQSTPGVSFYAKSGTSTIFYRRWDGTVWGSEQRGPVMGSATYNIRQIDTLSSDDRGKVAIVVKAATAANQQWWGTVYRFSADSFATTTQLGPTLALTTYNNLMNSCLGSLSSGDFFVVKATTTAAAYVNGTAVHAWSAASGWTYVADGPNPSANLVGCRLIRRPNTDNYMLTTFDSALDVGAAYYIGGSSYVDLWTAHNKYSYNERNVNQFNGEGFFDPGDNTRGAIAYTDSTTNTFTQGKYFIADNLTASFGAASNTPVFSTVYAQGSFATDDGNTGIAYFAGNDTANQLNVYKLDITGGSPAWLTTTNGNNISSGLMYANTNLSKPYDIKFYKYFYGLVTWGNAASTTPKYSIINASTNSVSASTSLSSASSSIYTRVKLYDDPNEDELLALYQSRDINYSAVFWNGAANNFYSTGNQSWKVLGTTTITATLLATDTISSFTYTARNAAPNTPTTLNQYKSDGVSVLANGDWTSSSSVYFNGNVTDPDTSEVLTVYVQVATTSGVFSSTTTPPAGACATSTTYSACTSKIWIIGTSVAGDYSSAPYNPKAVIGGLSESATGYKWQLMGCDDQNLCSNWTSYNAITPNFMVDTLAPGNLGNMVIYNKNSNSVRLTFGSQATETPTSNFLTYKVYYRAGAGATEGDASSTDANLAFINYNNATSTLISGLASSTLYSFKIYAYDKAGNKSISTEVSTTTSPGPIITQSSYIFENDDGVNVNSNSTSTLASTTLANVNIGQRINVRLQVENSGGDAMSSKVYKLQYNNFTDASSTWADVTNTSEIAFGLGLSGTNGDAITSSKASSNAKSWSNGSWHKGTANTNSYTLNSNAYTEFVFAIRTHNALLGKTYRLRLYNLTDNGALNNYANYATFSTLSNQVRRYSKGVYGTLPGTTIDLSYYFDLAGYNNVLTDNNTTYDAMSATAAYPISNYLYKNSTSSQALIVNWNGQSNVAASVSPVYLQIYRAGSVNAWETVASNLVSAANTDFNLSYTLNSTLSQYYDANYWTYWRVYQELGTQTLSSDYFNVATSTAAPIVYQKHYRFSDRNGNWLEAEDTRSPAASTSIQRNIVTRLRMSALNLGAGSAANYRFKIEYATTTGNCATDPGNWSAVTTDNTKAFRMSTTSTVTDQALTSAVLTSNGYTFVAGRYVASTSVMTASTTLAEGQYTENEYAFYANNNAVDGTTYCLRMTASGTPLNYYDNYAQITIGSNSNLAPVFIDGPAEDPIMSTSSSPVNNDTIFSFSGTATDTPTDSYYLAICQTNSVTPGDDAPPTCNGGAWCISSVASSGAQAICNATVSTTSEIGNWYGFACDKKFSVAKCSAMSQGTTTDDSGSPFYINHPPTYTVLGTQITPQNPGSNFVIQSTSSDTDIQGGADTLQFFVCATPSATAAGCASTTICSSVGSTTNANCNFTDIAPTPAGTTNYYGFIYDNHDATATISYRTSSYVINNVKPVLGSLILNGGNPIQLGLVGTTTPISTVIDVTENNGCQTGLISAAATIYYSNVAGGSGCSANDNTCYQVNVANCIKSNCVDNNDSTATYTCTAQFKYFAVPTDNFGVGNPYEPYNWTSYIMINDGTFSTSSSNSVELNTTQGLEVPQATINFGSIFSNQNTGTSSQQTAIWNAGNSPINTNLAGDDLHSAALDILLVSNMEWSFTPNFQWSLGNSVITSGSGGYDAPTNIARATTTATSTKNVYWGIGIPNGSISTLYTGLNYFTAIPYNAGW